jgi:hypothetical protein
VPVNVNSWAVLLAVRVAGEMAVITGAAPGVNITLMTNAPPLPEDGVTVIVPVRAAVGTGDGIPTVNTAGVVSWLAAAVNQVADEVTEKLTGDPEPDVRFTFWLRGLAPEKLRLVELAVKDAGMVRFTFSGVKLLALSTNVICP